MDIDTFIDKLEIECGCPGEGYIPCLDAVRKLKCKNENLNDVNDGSGHRLYNIKSQMKKLNKENEKLKEEIAMLGDELDEWRDALSDHNIDDPTALKLMVDDLMETFAKIKQLV